MAAKRELLQGGARLLAFLLAAVVVAMLLEGEMPQNEARARGLTVVGAVAALAAALLPRRSGGRLELALLLTAWCACALAVFAGPPWPWRGPHDAVVAWSIRLAVPSFVGAVLCRLHTAPHGRARRVLLWINALVLPGTVIAALSLLSLLL